MLFFEGSFWATLSAWQVLALSLCFVWSGFVRSGLGFGGAALALPLMLMIVNEPILLLPAICLHLLLFSSLTVASRFANVDWRYLIRLVLMLAVPFAAGLFGLLNLSGRVLSIVVYAVTLSYGLMYVLNRVLVSGNRWVDALCLAFGGYVSGVSLIGAPLIMAVSSRQLPVRQLRDTMFVVWIVLVIGKLSTFVVAGVDLQWRLALAMLPLTGLGHWLGLKLHSHLISGDRQFFNRIIGGGLMLVSIFGLASSL